MIGWLLGIDAGGTRTRAALALAEGEELFRGEGGPCNWTTLGEAECLAGIEAAVAGAWRAAGRSEEPLAAACVCSAGYYPRHHEARARAALAARWPGARLRLETDLAAAWAGALAGEPGIILVAGTGSVAYGRGPEGREARAGGWGPLFGDEGSAYWLVRRALAAVAQAADGRGAETLLAETLRGSEAAELPAGEWLRELLRRAPGREELAGMACGVTAAADRGDPVAVRLLEEAGEELARAVMAVERSLDYPAIRRWSWAGGLAAGAPALRERIQETLAAGGSRLEPVPPRGDPATGALWMARELAASAGRGEGPV